MLGLSLPLPVSVLAIPPMGTAGGAAVPAGGIVIVSGVGLVTARGAATGGIGPYPNSRVSLFQSFQPTG